MPAWKRVSRVVPTCQGTTTLSLYSVKSEALVLRFRADSFATPCPLISKLRDTTQVGIITFVMLTIRNLASFFFVLFPNAKYAATVWAVWKILFQPCWMKTNHQPLSPLAMSTDWFGLASDWTGMCLGQTDLRQILRKKPWRSFTHKKSCLAKYLHTQLLGWAPAPPPHITLISTNRS